MVKIFTIMKFLSWSNLVVPVTSSCLEIRNISVVFELMEGSPIVVFQFAVTCLQQVVHKLVAGRRDETVINKPDIDCFEDVLVL